MSDTTYDANGSEEKINDVSLIDDEQAHDTEHIMQQSLQVKLLHLEQGQQLARTQILQQSEVIWQVELFMEAETSTIKHQNHDWH